MTDQNQDQQSSQAQNAQSGGSELPPPISGQQQQQQYQGQAQYQQQGQPSYGMQGGAPMQNYMVMNIIATVVGLLACGNCCISLILGIVGIVFSSQVNSKFMMGDVNGANSSASTAKILGIISLVLSGLTLIGTITYYGFLLSSGEFGELMDVYRDALEQAQ